MDLPNCLLRAGITASHCHTYRIFSPVFWGVKGLCACTAGTLLTESSPQSDYLLFPLLLLAILSCLNTEIALKTLSQRHLGERKPKAVFI